MDDKRQEAKEAAVVDIDLTGDAASGKESGSDNGKRRRKPRKQKQLRPHDRKWMLLAEIAVAVSVIALIAAAAVVIHSRLFPNAVTSIGSDVSPILKRVTWLQEMPEGIAERVAEISAEKTLALRQSFFISAAEAMESSEILSCEIDADTGEVEIACAIERRVDSDDNYYYLFRIAVYEEEIPAEAAPVAKEEKASELTFSTPLHHKGEDTGLFDKYLVAVMEHGVYVPITAARYITNPEAVASYNYSGRQHNSVKGLLVDPTRVAGSELTDLGVNYATYNIPLSRILGGTSNGAYPTITYSYGGVTYHFNGAVIHEYDYLFTTISNKGIDIAAIILNNASTGSYPELTHPQARSGSTAPYRMFNAAEERGVKAIAAVASFLAERYSGAGHGNVSMWIIGNEVNARKEWNYMASGTSLADYTAAYTRAFRVFYNAIKSVNAGAKVYIPLDQQWDRNRANNPDYDGRDMLDLFAASLKGYGDIGWGLAYHPYSYPNDNTEFWKASSLVTDSASTSIITMKNLQVLTDYMQREELLKEDGEMRSIILSEFGYTSTSGQELQAAAFAYAYRIIEANGHIDAIMLSRETDASEEISAYNLALGLTTTGGGHKRIYDVYKYIDTERSDEVCAFAEALIGIKFP